MKWKKYRLSDKKNSTVSKEGDPGGLLGHDGLKKCDCKQYILL